MDIAKEDTLAALRGKLQGSLEKKGKLDVIFYTPKGEPVDRDGEDYYRIDKIIWGDDNRVDLRSGMLVCIVFALVHHFARLFGTTTKL